MVPGKMSLSGQETRKSCSVKYMLKLSLLYVTSAPRMDWPASQTWLAGRDWDTEKEESSSLPAGRNPVASTVESDFMRSN